MATDGGWRDWDAWRMDDAALTSGTRRRGEPVPGLFDLAPSAASTTLARSLGTVFVPSAQTNAVIRLLLGATEEHLRASYPSHSTYQRGLHAARSPSKPVEALCLTGLAGVGKSSLIQALRRLLSSAVRIASREKAPGTQPEGIWYAAVESSATPKDLLRKLVPESSTQLSSLSSRAKVVEWAGRFAFKHRVGLLVADELQFVTQSATANSATTKLLHELRYIGLPVCFVANYSLCHRLAKRPQEDQHRLLSRPMVMLPDSPDDPSMKELCAEYKRASGGALFTSAATQIEQVHDYTAGLKRLRVSLMSLAFRLVRERRADEVSSADLELAYRSAEFTQARQEVELLRRQAATGRRERDDLWCPFELPNAAVIAASRRAIQAGRERVQSEALHASMTQSERQSAQDIRADLSKTCPDANQNKMTKRRNQKVTYESLVQGANRMKEAGLVSTPLLPSRPVKQLA